MSPRYAPSTSNRFNAKNVDWIRFRELVDDGLRGTGMAPDGCSDPVVSYSKFFYLITRTVERCGAYRPSSAPGKRKSRPLWWDSECDAAILRRREALRTYTTSQTREGRATCRRVDEEVKRFLRRQKHLSFISFCESIDPSMGLSRIWKTVKSLSSRVAGSRTDRVTGPDSTALVALREELVCPSVFWARVF